MRRRCQSRRGATAVEFAFVGSAAFVVLFGLLIGGLGVFRYQQVVRVAREGSRWASVHGTSYAAATGKAAATATDVYNNAIVPYASGLNLNRLTYSVAWNTSNSPSYTSTSGTSQVTVANTVTVTVNYNWIPEAYVGAITMSSSSVSVMTY